MHLDLGHHVKAGDAESNSSLLQHLVREPPLHACERRASDPSPAGSGSGGVTCLNSRRADKAGAFTEE